MYMYIYICIHVYIYAYIYIYIINTCKFSFVHDGTIQKDCRSVPKIILFFRSFFSSR